MCGLAASIVCSLIMFKWKWSASSMIQVEVSYLKLSTLRVSFCCAMLCISPVQFSTSYCYLTLNVWELVLETVTMEC